MCSSDRSPDFSDEWHTVLCDVKLFQGSFLNFDLKQFFFSLCEAIKRLILKNKSEK